MASRSTGPNIAPLIAVVGETASGKTALAIELARRFNGAIICADSRTIYKGMDVGTAKPTLEERAGILHYGLDIVEPGEQFTAFDFQQLAYRAIEDIAGRGMLPIMVGGSGLYVDAVLYDFMFRPRPKRAEDRAALSELTVETLQQRVRRAGYDLPQNATNRRHLSRLLEAGPSPKQPRKLRLNTLVVGLKLSTDELRLRIEQRVNAMFAAGLIDEVRRLVARYNEAEALRAPGYKAAAAYLSGMVSLDEAKQQFVREDLRLARRQRTWFKRNANIHWLDNRDRVGEAVALVTTFLSRQ